MIHLRSLNEYEFIYVLCINLSDASMYANKTFGSDRAINSQVNHQSNDISIIWFTLCFGKINSIVSKNIKCGIFVAKVARLFT